MTTTKIETLVTSTKTTYEHTCDICHLEADFLERCHICGRDMCVNCGTTPIYDGWGGYMSDDTTEGYCKQCAHVGKYIIRDLDANDIYYSDYVERSIREWKRQVRNKRS